MHPRNVGIVGYGRFGRFWDATLQPYHKVLVTDSTPMDAAHFVPLEELCRTSEAIFLCVPIGRLEEALEDLAGQLRPGTIVFDTCSVKMLPVEWMRKSLEDVEGVTLVATHPMFGPDSGRDGLEGLPMAAWFLSGDRATYQEWAGFFRELRVNLVEISPTEHDRLAAYSQGITHYIGRVLGELDLRSTPIDTQGFSILHALIEQTCNDTWELFRDLQVYNPFTREMRLELETALERIYTALLPGRISPDRLLVGVQGGEGSFSEEAARFYTSQLAGRPEADYIHLFTAKNVLHALHRGEIDRGVIALHNARGGAVMESVDALAEARCEILETFELVIDHCLLHHPDAPFNSIDTVMSHPQALAQCADTLEARYPGLKQVSGEGDRIDQALCARLLSAGELPRTTAVLAPRVCAARFGLAIHACGLQDLGDRNRTTFAWLKRREPA